MDTSQSKPSIYTPDKKIIRALHLLGCGSQYHVFGDANRLSQATIHIFKLKQNKKFLFGTYAVDFLFFFGAIWENHLYDESCPRWQT